jgi:hypothetical protein
MKPCDTVETDVNVDAANALVVLPVRANPRPRRQQYARAQPLGLVLLVLALACPAQATIIIGMRDAEEIIIGADGIAGQTRSGSMLPMCKVHRVDERTIFGFSGNMRYNRSNFHVPRAIRDLLHRHGTSRAGQDAMAAALLARLTQELATAVVNDPLLLPGTTMADVLIGRITESGTPEVARHYFRVAPSAAGSYIVHDVDRCPGNCLHDPKSQWFVPFGAEAAWRAVSAASRNWQAYRDAIRREGLAGFIRELLAVGIAAAPKDCGGKISRAHLTAKGVQWVERGECRDDQTADP